MCHKELLISFTGGETESGREEMVSVHLLRQVEEAALRSWLAELCLGDTSSGFPAIPQNLKHEVCPSMLTSYAWLADPVS